MKQGISDLLVDSTVTAFSFYSKNGFVQSGDPIYEGDMIVEYPMEKTLNGLNIEHKLN